MRHKVPLIEARELGFRINGTLILHCNTFSLGAGEMVGLIGANGAGKTTLLKVLGGLWQGTQGEVRLVGRPLGSISPREVARLVAHVPQSTATDFAFTVRELVLMGRNPHLGRFQLERPQDRAVAEEAMQRMGIEKLADRLITTLSGGECQRVFIARALAQQPRILLLDEPTANLDIKHQLQVLSLVRELAQQEGLGVMAAIHDLGLAARFSDRLILLHEGCILADAEPEAVLTPHNLAVAFGVQARVYRDPHTQSLQLSLA